jgi:hypothetical protein
MPKPNLTSRAVFVSTLNLSKNALGRVIFAVLNWLLATPVIFYTRTRACLRALRAHVNLVANNDNRNRAFKQAGLALVLGVVLATGLAATLVRPAYAVASTTLNFQAKLEGADGAIAPDGNYNVEFKLYSASTGGTALWTEDHLNSASNGLRLDNGYLTVELGSVTAFPSTIHWDQATYITMNIGGTSTGSPTYDGEMNPRLKLTAVPYAFQAKSAEQLSISNGTFVTTLTVTPPTANRSITLPDASGTVCLDASVNNCNYASAAGSAAYIQNGTTLQGTANFNIQSKSATDATAVIQAYTGQTADLITFRNAAGTAPTSGINASGQLYYQSGSYTGTLVQDTLTHSTNVTYHLPDQNYANQTLCTYEAGNCAGSGSGITGSGTTNYVARFNTGSTINASSLLYDDGTVIGIGATGGSGLLDVKAASTSQSGVFVDSFNGSTVATAVIRAASSQTGDLLDFTDPSNTPVTLVDVTGNILSSATATLGSTTALSGTLAAHKLAIY